MTISLEFLPTRNCSCLYSVSCTFWKEALLDAKGECSGYIGANMTCVDFTWRVAVDVAYGVLALTAGMKVRMDFSYLFQTE